LLASLSIWAVLGYGKNLASPKSVISSLVLKLGKNTADSFALYHRVRALDDLPFYQAYDYSEHDLLGKPNIYLIFVESYGGILYSRDRLRGTYTDLLDQLASELKEGGWFAATALSESPTWGGGSWMAYTSALFGLRIDNHPQYLALQQRFQEEEYPDLGHYFQSQGYRYVGATSLAVELDDESWQKYKDFYGVDSWIRYSDLNYKGMHYGWGPSPPDQYVLNAVNEELNGQSDQPFLLFWITQNSHYPWRRVPQVVDDWRAMNDGNAVVNVFGDDSTSLAEKQDNYLEAITYELSFLKEFILNEAGDDDIFVLMGDHQPGYIGRRSDGFGTPLHIISKDKSLVQAFAEYGFDPGLEVQDPSPSMRHEGFYSLFMRVFLQQYGQGHSKLPPYLPDGIQLGDS
jgi:phosphoglycerol transferase MdoB-like AlkP superfamily enzyme